MEQFKNYLLHQADKPTAWLGVIGLTLQFLGLGSILFVLFVAMIVLPLESFSSTFSKWTQHLKDLDKKQQ